MQIKNCKILLILFTINYVTLSCENFVEVDTPTHKMVTKTVFASEETAKAAVTGIYNELFNAEFANGYTSSVTVLAGMSPDTFEATSATDDRYGPFQKNEIAPGESPDALANLNLWSSAYNIVYMCNSVLEGLASSSHISEETSLFLEGQVRFIRAFTYFYLVNLYGDVPLVLSTDYQQNAVMGRQIKEEVWQQIIEDLDIGITLLGGDITYVNDERTTVNLFAVKALRARVYLYDKDWQNAEKLSTDVITQVSLYEILDDLNQVFLMNSREAIWQISPLGGPGGGAYITYTWEGYMSRGINSSQIKLSERLIYSFEPRDKRLSQWVGYNESRDFYHPYKYKDGNSWQNVSEYSMVMRLAEQYLIRAEARAMQDDITGAIADIDVIRHRAGLDLIADINPTIEQKDLLKIIMEERKKELLSEWGHRWFDLKRTGKATEILSVLKPQWEPTDIYYPIPNEERAKNPNLGEQNEGY